MRVSFDAVGQLPNESDMRKLVALVGFEIPDVVKVYFMQFGGGVPNPFLLRIQDFVDTEVSYLLSILADSGGPSIGDVYLNFRESERVPQGFLPFAVDGGGDFFFVNCLKSSTPTFFYDSKVNRRLIDLDRGFEDFWDLLESE